MFLKEVKRKFLLGEGDIVFKKYKYICLLAVLFLGIDLANFPLQAEESVKDSKSDKKYKLSICAIFKNEASYLREWIEYHRLIGVNHFYLYDNGSRDRSADVLMPYIREGLVTLVYWPDRVVNDQDTNTADWALSTQLPAYENAAKYRALNETEWLAFIDVDEYLVPVHTNTIVEVLDRYEDHSGLQLTSDYFDASHIDALPRRELLIATVELTGKPAQNIQKSVEKTIFKPEDHTTFSWPPYKCNFKEGDRAAKVSKIDVRINKYVNRFKGALNFGKLREKLHVDNRLLTESETRELLEVGFEIEDRERVISRFEPALRKNMGMETGWNW
ncbi:MAG: glycosyltransferase family 92 protein [Verrucomicrobia bacterium]|nr:glycosyltransferase family 92 protein [Verrucomicrobiota bacterium]